MKAIVVMFDSLNRHFLSCYGCGWARTPNFDRLAARAVAFDNSYVCSMPCMPARRDFHTGRPNFLHRSWGPLEPFDDSGIELLRQAGVRTHLTSDHYHYWEDGGATYHNRYDTWQANRGQEGDPWIGHAGPPLPFDFIGSSRPQDRVNRQFIVRPEDWPQSRTFADGLDYIERNHGHDRWLLHIETFDPHEPFFVPQHFRDLYPSDYAGPLFDHPKSHRLDETPEQVGHIRKLYASLVAMCDHHLGQVLDAMDRHDLWRDTLLLVLTDHGYLLGENDYWGKCWMPMFNEVARTPFFLWDPRSGRRGERRAALVQPTIDAAPTLLDFFGLEPTPRMLGKNLADALADPARALRQTAIFGMHGAHVNITDGRHVYMRGPDLARPINQYILMPTHMRGFFDLDDLRQSSLDASFSFTRGVPVMKVPGTGRSPRLNPDYAGTMLFDLEADPRQERPASDPAAEARLVDGLVGHFLACEAPPELYGRFGLERPQPQDHEEYGRRSR